MTDRRPIGIDLFCGVGGMSLGFEQAGCDVVAAFDFEERHVVTYKENFPHTRAFVVDLAKASGRQLRRLSAIGDRVIDVLFGGPPCQGFSVIGKRDLSDPRNLLVLDFARLIRELRPKYFVVENVKGLLLGHAREIVKSFRRRIRLARYDIVEPIEVLDGADFGVPQRRRRAFILGYRRDACPPCYPTPSGVVGDDGAEYFPTVQDAIGDLPEIERYDELYERDGFSGELGAPSHYARLMRGAMADPSDEATPRSCGTSVLTGCLRTRHSSTTIERFRRTKPGKVERVSRFYRLDPKAVAPTIRAGTGSDHGGHTAPRPIHPRKPRCITVREAARLHSFPDWFQFHTTRWHAFRQIGNSVPPRLARAVAASLLSVPPSLEELAHHEFPGAQ